MVKVTIQCTQAENGRACTPMQNEGRGVCGGSEKVLKPIILCVRPNFEETRSRCGSIYKMINVRTHHEF